MQKKLNKLTLSRETLRNLAPRELDLFNGGGTTSNTITSNPTYSCASVCFGCATNASNCCP